MSVSQPAAPAHSPAPTPTEFGFPTSGERFAFRSPPEDRDRLVFDFWVEPGGGVFVNHRHLLQTERFRCVSGVLDVTAAGVEHRLEPGQEFTLAPGTLHTLVNGGDTEVHCEVEYEPAGRNREWFLLMAAAIHRTGKEPSLLDLAPFVLDVDIYLSAPIPLQKALFRFVLKPLAIVLGRRRRMLGHAAAVYGPDFRWA